MHLVKLVFFVLIQDLWTRGRTTLAHTLADPIQRLDTDLTAQGYDDMLQTKEAGPRAHFASKLRRGDAARKKTLQLGGVGGASGGNGGGVFQVQTFFDNSFKKHGKLFFIPKDVNKNHYFIGQLIIKKKKNRKHKINYRNLSLT